jgi:hypothetical protein
LSGRNTIGEPFQDRRIVEDRVVIKPLKVGRRVFYRDVPLLRAIHAPMHHVEAAGEVWQRAAAVGEQEAQLWKPIKNTRKDQ